MVSSTGSRAWRRVRVWGLGKNVVRAERGERCRALGGEENEVEGGFREGKEGREG